MRISPRPLTFVLLAATGCLGAFTAPDGGASPTSGGGPTGGAGGMPTGGGGGNNPGNPTGVGGGAADAGIVAASDAAVAASSDLAAPRDAGKAPGDATIQSHDAMATVDLATAVTDLATAVTDLATAPNCIPTTPALTSGHHNPGQACLRCHDGNNAPFFSAAGTLFNAVNGGNTVAGSTIELVDANGANVRIVTSQNGNFYTSQTLAFPLVARASGCPYNVPMIAKVQSGECNGCHGGQLQIHLP